ncbi:MULTISPECIES: 3-isopropylmalate dehydratase [unclassified Roseobacter]|uniref:3-isopropylmalate dehydratase n=1 Tax=unclassified Roseobacter TaxID=196798 RepID=UPI00209C0877|nr:MULTISPECIES: 3-isopropylmalate dehydratase [unclassified Roseobacter]
MSDPMHFAGRAWVFGDNVALDGDLMALHFALARETDPQVLRQHIFAGIDSTLAERIQPGDLIVTGRRFAHGNPHIQGLIGLQGAGSGLICESIASGAYRCAVNAALPFLPRAPGITQMVAQGDQLEVDFRTGAFRNVTQDIETRFDPLPEIALSIIARGGWLPSFRDRLARHATA